MTDHRRAEGQPPTATRFQLGLANEAATVDLGKRLATTIVPGLKIYLHGDLGAGKTTLSRALLKALGHAGRVKSPTYTLVEVYDLSRLNLYHFDFYRFRDAQEWREAGFSEYFGGDAVCLVEWPEKVGDDLPPPDLDIFMAMVGDDDGIATDSNEERRAEIVARSTEQRRVDIIAHGTEQRRAEIVARTAKGQRCVASLTSSYSHASSS